MIKEMRPMHHCQRMWSLDHLAKKDQIDLSPSPRAVFGRDPLLVMLPPGEVTLPWIESSTSQASAS